MRLWPLLLLPAFAVSAFAADTSRFDRFFEDRTLRVDYVHYGAAKDETIALDRLFRGGIWAGSRVHLTDDADLGEYRVRLYDAASNELIFSRSFNSYFGEWKTSEPALRGVRRAYHESALVPLPKAKARFVVEDRGRDDKYHKLFETTIDPTSYEIATLAPPRDVKVYEQWIGGDPHASVDIVFVGEGYAAAEEAKFRADLERYTAIFFSQEPYKRLKDKFNIRGALRFSEESGCSEPSRGVYKRTALGATYDSLGSERYMLTEDNGDLRDIAGAVPYDAVFVMVNQKRYGGGGIYNFYCTFATDNQWSPYIFLHEFGHSFAGLADEYFTSSVAYVDLPTTTVEPREPNVTVLPKGRPLKWADLATAGTPVPTPWEKGGFEVLDLGLQKERETLNKRIAARMREGAPQGEVDALKAQAEELSTEHAKLVDAYLAKSKFKGQVGAFEGANYIAHGFYRPALDCIMFTKGAKPFCPVCARAIERTIARYGE